jgi:hypothetical protein
MEGRGRCVSVPLPRSFVALRGRRSRARPAMGRKKDAVPCLVRRGVACLKAAKLGSLSGFRAIDGLPNAEVGAAEPRQAQVERPDRHRPRGVRALPRRRRGRGEAPRRWQQRQDGVRRGRGGARGPRRLWPVVEVLCPHGRAAQRAACLLWPSTVTHASTTSWKRGSLGSSGRLPGGQTRVFPRPLSPKFIESNPASPPLCIQSPRTSAPPPQSSSPPRPAFLYYIFPPNSTTTNLLAVLLSHHRPRRPSPAVP